MRTDGSAGSFYAICPKMERFLALSQYLRFSLNLFIWFFWTFCGLKKSLYFAKSQTIETFLGPINQEYKNFTNAVYYTFPKFYVMMLLFGRLIAIITFQIIMVRRCQYVSIRRRGDVQLRRLGDVPPRRHCVFHLRYTCYVAGTYR